MTVGVDLHAALAQRIFIPLYERRWGTHIGDLLGDLERSQFASSDEVQRGQQDRLRQLLDFLRSSNGFYRDRLASVGFSPGDLHDLSDLARLPLLTKEDIRQHGEALISDGFRKSDMLHKRTGGSTGVPVHLYWDRAAERFKRALVKRHDAWAGFRLGRKQAVLWGDTERKKYPFKERLYRALCARAIFLDTLEMDDAYLAAFVERLRRFRPAMLMGHAHSIFFFTQYLRSEGIDDIRFETIISTAENLVPAERDIIEAHFGKVLFDRYGCEELSIVASECEAHEGLHVAAEGLIVEVLEGDERTPGRVVVTDLVNRGMPLLRYEVGDLATMADGACPCGRGLPRLGRVFGRTTDILYAPDGRRISGVSILDTFLIHVPGVRQGQIVQDALDHIRLKIVPDTDFDDDTVTRLARTVTDVFGAAMRHDLELVDAIAPTARGKFQFTICEIDRSGRPTTPRR